MTNHLIDDTHDPALQSWLESANDPVTDFPIQNLPFGRFRRADDMDWRIGVAIGDQVLDLRRARVIQSYDINLIMRLSPEPRRALREAISQGLRAGSPNEQVFRDALVPQSRVEVGLPCSIGDYTDFYTSIHHATTVGKQFRPDNPLLPNYKWVPIGYHGRSSSIQVSRRGVGHTFARPNGQTMAAGAQAPTLTPSARMDYELELGFFIARPNAIGVPISMDEAEDHVFGVALFNDWTARDIQPWEYQPLGPFLSKNFASTLSPWMVTMDALAPFRAAFRRPEGDPAPLPYLDSAHNREHGAVDILVNNAGIQHVSPVDEFPMAKWEQILAINLSSNFYTIRAALPGMKQLGLGPHHQHRVRPRPGGFALQVGLRRGQTRRRRLDQDRGPRGRRNRHHLQCGLPRLREDSAGSRTDPRPGHGSPDVGGTGGARRDPRLAAEQALRRDLGHRRHRALPVLTRGRHHHRHRVAC
jgi:fumarylacetoacetase